MSRSQTSPKAPKRPTSPHRGQKPAARAASHTTARDLQGAASPTTPPKRGRGALSGWKPEFIPTVKVLAGLGATDSEIARALSVTGTTIQNWKLRHPDFVEALREKEAADQRVVASLYKRATGYVRKNAVKHFYDAKKGEVVVAVYDEEHPPDTTACIFWLKNRQRDRWRDRHDLTVAPTGIDDLLNALEGTGDAEEISRTAPSALDV